MNANAAYEKLIAWSRERALLEGCIELVSWEELTYMPHGGVENRGRQMAYLAGLYHDLSIDPRIADLLYVVADSPLAADPHSDAAINVRWWRREYDRQIRLPRALTAELASVATSAQQEWAEARRNSDFQQFRPWLDQIVLLKRAEAECLELGGPLYDALLDDYEPGSRCADLAPMFAALRTELSQFLSEIAAAPRKTKTTILRRDYPLDRQRIFCEAVAGDLGFDFHRGRLDSTTHPFFSNVGPGDCRITTRYSYNDFSDAFFAMLHEMGHGLYEQGLDAAHYGTPLGQSNAMSLHESQSRLWEKFVGLSRPFWKHFFPRAREVFHDTLHKTSLEDFYRAVNHVQPGANRVKADAVTYDLHILLRFELEQALIAGDLAAGDVPGAWNEKSQAYLGVTPANDAEGCLQDSQWAAAQVGYFPTYTLGNMYAAQIWAAAHRALPTLDKDMAGGAFEGLREWLAENLYRHGQRWPAAELLTRITGQPPSHKPLVAALREKYREIYGIA